MTAAVVLMLAHAVACADKPEGDLGRLQGEWKVVKAVRGGREATAAEIEKLKVVVKGARLSVDEGTARDEQAEIAIVGGGPPAAVDFKPTRPGKDVIKGIYKIDGDSLTLCWAKSGDRPAAFASAAGTEQVLMELTRAK